MLKILSGFGFLTGVSYPFRALGVLKNNPRLWGYLVAPIILNIFLGLIFYGGIIFVGWETLNTGILKIEQGIDQLIANLPQWLSILDNLILVIGLILYIFLVIIFLGVTGFIFLQFGVIIGAPWYGQLSEQLEKLRTGKLEVVEVGFIQDIWRAILFEFKKIALMILVGLPLLLLNILPGIGTLMTTVGGFILTATLVCLDFLDSPLERRRFSFRKKLGIIAKSLPASAGFGLVCLGLISIPLLNLITIPICVASGTLFVCDRVLAKLSS